MTFTPYLTFNGNCEEAMTFYAALFGAEDLMFMRFKDAPPDAGLPPTDLAMHAQFSLGGHVLMASDAMPGEPFNPQASVSISHVIDDYARAEVLFNALAEGGEIVMPFEPTFFSPGFGMTKDRFGTHWMIMLPDEDP